MRLVGSDKLKQHYAWWNDENKEIFAIIVDAQPTVERSKREKQFSKNKTFFQKTIDKLKTL